MRSTLYEKVVLQISELIDSGSLLPGAPIPSIRALKTQLRVSTSTVVQAYSILEAKGLIEARPKSGFYVRPRILLPTSLPKSQIIKPAIKRLKISDFVTAVIQQCDSTDLVPFGTASPALELLPLLELNRQLGRSVRKLGADSIRYDIPPGCPQLRKQLEVRSLGWGRLSRANEIVTTNGAVESMTLALMAVARAGDVIAIESPTFFGILQIIGALGMQALEIPSHPSHGMDVGALKVAIKRTKVAACLVIPNFHNPLGFCMADSAKKELVSILNNSGIPLIENDIYGDLGHGNSSRPTIAGTYDKKGLVITCSSFSKSLAPGLRVGWILPGHFMERIQLLKSTVIGESPSITQFAVAEFLRAGAYDRHLRKFRFALANQMAALRSGVSRYFPSQTRMSDPRGGFVLWVELPKRVNGLSLQQAAVKHGISIAPGPIFSTANQYKNYIRLSCGHPWTGKEERALQELGRLTSQMS